MLLLPRLPLGGGVFLNENGFLNLNADFMLGGVEGGGGGNLAGLNENGFIDLNADFMFGYK